MTKNSFTVIIVPDASSRLHKVRIPLPSLYTISAAALLVLSICVSLGLNYAQMVLKTAEYDQLKVENASLKVENRNLEVAARQLNTKIRGLEDLSDQIQTMMETDTWNRRLGLVETEGVGGTQEDYPTATMISTLNVRDNINLARDYTASLEDQLLFAEELAARRAQELLWTPSLWPVSGPIRSSFGRRRDPFTGQSEMHLGLDIGALYGAQVRSPANGRVLYAQRRSAYGNLIVVDHGGGITTRFGHLSRFAVKAGDLLTKGDVIGFVGSTGRSTGPHLHYEVRLNDRPINPREYLPVDAPSIAD